MKKLKLILVLAFLMPLTMMAQKGPFDNLFEKYQNADDVTSISINMSAISINLGSGHNDFGDMMDQVDFVKVLQFENHYKSFRNSDFFKEIDAIIEKNNYVQLIEVRSKDENVNVYIVEGDDDVILEGLIIAQEDEEATIVSVRGKMKPSDFASMHKKSFHGFNFSKHH
jgi:hypothetical protein